ncbi:MAG: hypothetical protein PHY45_00295 [Rhodocyclaceae bacterium]|nr:hypothetical protein [Rhodocyclaceae bacterium]
MQFFRIRIGSTSILTIARHVSDSDEERRWLRITAWPFGSLTQALRKDIMLSTLSLLRL